VWPYAKPVGGVTTGTFVVQGGRNTREFFFKKREGFVIATRACVLCIHHIYPTHCIKANLKRNMQHTYTHTHTRGVSNSEPGIYTLRSFCAREGEGEREWGKLTKTSRRR